MSHLPQDDLCGSNWAPLLESAIWRRVVVSSLEIFNCYQRQRGDQDAISVAIMEYVGLLKTCLAEAGEGEAERDAVAEISLALAFLQLVEHTVVRRPADLCRTLFLLVPLPPAASDRLQTLLSRECLDTCPDYWPCVYTSLLSGDLGTARQLLAQHTDAGQVAFHLAVSLLTSKEDCGQSGAELTEFITTTKSVASQVSAVSELAVVARILGGEEEALLEVERYTGGWMQLMTARIFYCGGDLAGSARWAQRRNAQPSPTDAALLALLSNDMKKFLHELSSLTAWWLPATLADLLDAPVRDHLLRAHASSLALHPALFDVALCLLGQLGEEGRALAGDLILRRTSLDVIQATRLARRHGADHVVTALFSLSISRHLATGNVLRAALLLARAPFSAKLNSVVLHSLKTASLDAIISVRSALAGRGEIFQLYCDIGALGEELRCGRDVSSVNSLLALILRSRYVPPHLLGDLLRLLPPLQLTSLNHAAVACAVVNLQREAPLLELADINMYILSSIA